ncbi:uncharacterized protein [Epargyreus clarus]|uniref:uncharacterized protein n=1 Tax=Epargyreus clarus TaxID=520877 RepID=UPI003C2D4760
MVNCSVANCKNTSAKISKTKDGITFHRFPRDEERRQQWEIAMNREEDWSSTTSSAVCSEHFEAKDFYITESGLRRLCVDAVPTINISPCQELVPTISCTQPIDIDTSDSDEVIQLKYRVKRLEIISNNRKRKINLIGQSKRRLKEKVELMRGLIKHLIENNEKKNKQIQIQVLEEIEGDEVLN